MIRALEAKLPRELTCLVLKYLEKYDATHKVDPLYFGVSMHVIKFYDIQYPEGLWDFWAHPDHEFDDSQEFFDFLEKKGAKTKLSFY